MRSIVGGTKNAEGPLHTLGVLGVPSQLKMYNLDCWGPGEYLDTNIVEVGEKIKILNFPPKSLECRWNLQRPGPKTLLSGVC